MEVNSGLVRVTLAQVAAEAGVAESTASRILNGYTKQFRVRPEVRQRVLDAAARLSYLPNPMVRSIAAKRTNLVALVGAPREELDHAAVDGACGLMIEAGKHVGSPFLMPEDRAMRLPSWRVDGAMAVGVNGATELEAVQAAGVPYVSLNGARGDRGDSVCIDSDRSAHALLEHLRSLGHRRVTVFMPMKWPSQECAKPWICDRRLRAVQAAARELGLHLVDASLTDEANPEWCLDRIASSLATAVVCVSDVPACLLIHEAMRRGIAVPAQLSVVSMCVSTAGRVMWPSVTSIEVDGRSFGRTAAALLLERMAAEHHMEPRDIVVEPAFLPGGSSGPAPVH